MKKIIGFQLCNANGENIQGNPGEDPTGLASFEVMTIERAIIELENYGGLLMPIFEGDIEDPRVAR